MSDEDELGEDARERFLHRRGLAGVVLCPSCSGTGSSASSSSARPPQPSGLTAAAEVAPVAADLLAVAMGSDDVIARLQRRNRDLGARCGGGPGGHGPSQHGRDPARRGGTALRPHADPGRGHLRGGGRHHARPRQLRQRPVRRGVGRRDPAALALSLQPPGDRDGRGRHDRVAGRAGSSTTTAATRWRSGAIRRSSRCRSSCGVTFSA